MTSLYIFHSLPWLSELASRIFMSILKQNTFENLTKFLYFEPKICFSKFKQISCVKKKNKEQMFCPCLRVKANIIDKICIINDQFPCQKASFNNHDDEKDFLNALLMETSSSFESGATTRTWWIIWGIESSLMYVQCRRRQFSGLLASWSCQGFYWSILPT